MRVKTVRGRSHDRVGEVVIQRCHTLRYLSGSRVQKFYQQMWVSFVPEDAGDTQHFGVSNWGAGAEAPIGSDLKGSIKINSYTNEWATKNVNEVMVSAKLKRGYISYSEFSAGANAPIPAKLLAELHMIEEEEPVATVEPGPLWDVETEMLDLSASVLQAIAKGDVAQAISYRRALLDLLERVSKLQDHAAGQLEILNLKLAAELR